MAAWRLASELIYFFNTFYRQNILFRLLSIFAIPFSRRIGPQSFFLFQIYI